MEEQIPPSQAPAFVPPQEQTPYEGTISLEQLSQMKARARELAIQQAIAQQTASQNQQLMQPQQKVVYVRRNLTVAELLIVLLISCGIVTGFQWTWSTLVNNLPRIEVKVR